MGKGFEKEPIRHLRQHIFRRIISQAVLRRNPVLFLVLRGSPAGLVSRQNHEGRREHASRRRRHKTFLRDISIEIVTVSQLTV
jgi:hypothetical protein